MKLPLRYASYHLHLVSALAHLRRAKPSLQEQIALVQALDSALELLESEATFQRFAVLGGCAALEDYLQLRPEHFERLEAAAQRGELWINPFYSPPQPALHSPEGIIRNLLRGTASARLFGGVASAALCSGADELPAWLPQVLRGFNLGALLVDWRSLQPSEQAWRGDDGSQVLLLAAESLSASDAALEDAYQRRAPHCHSGHLMLLHRWAPLSAQAWRAWFANLQRARPMDILMHSAPETYLRALRLQVPPLQQGALRRTEPPQSDSDAFARLEGFLSQSFEPLMAFAALRGSPCLPRQPQRLIDQLWQPLFDWEHEPLEEAQAALAAHGRSLEAAADFLAQECGVDRAIAPIERLVRADDARFQLSACKLPADPTRSGLIVRGKLNAPEGAWIALTPWRPFAHCEVVSLSETPTGGGLAVEADGSVHFRAEPQHFYTLWLHD